jgi:hypothetical protein
MPRASATSIWNEAVHPAQNWHARNLAPTQAFGSSRDRLLPALRIGTRASDLKDPDTGAPKTRPPKNTKSLFCRGRKTCDLPIWPLPDLFSRRVASRTIATSSRPRTAPDTDQGLTRLHHMTVPSAQALIIHAPVGSRLDADEGGASIGRRLKAHETLFAKPNARFRGGSRLADGQRSVVTWPFRSAKWRIIGGRFTSTSGPGQLHRE